jgi:hypothetical protein
MHPPFPIPWSEIKVQRGKGWVFEYAIFTDRDVALNHKHHLPCSAG